MKKLLLGLFAIGLTLPTYAQITETELSEVTVYATNYKYLQNVNTGELASIPVEMLERKVAAYDVKGSEVYHDDYDYYEISFYIPDGTILAAYDKEGTLLRTAERFKDVNLPKAVQKAVQYRFPEWKITNDVYVVSYHEHKGMTKKYKLRLENGDKTLRVKLDEKGTFL